MATIEQALDFAKRFFELEYEATKKHLTERGGDLWSPGYKPIIESQRQLKAETLFVDSGHPAGEVAINALKERGASTEEILEALRQDPLSRVRMTEYPFWVFVEPRGDRSDELTDEEIKAGQEKLKTFAPRTIFKVQHWLSGSKQHLFVFETSVMDSEHISREEPFHRFIAWANEDGDLKMAIRETRCTTCKASGDITPKCSECRGTGWERPKLLSKVKLKELVEEKDVA